MTKLLLANLKMTFRNRQQLFWNLAFPIIFAVLFGFFFGSGSVGVGTVGLVKSSTTPLADTLQKGLSETSLFKIKEESSVETAKEELKKSKIALIVEIPADFGAQKQDAPTKLTLISDPANQTQNAVVRAYLDQFLTQVNFESQHVKPIFGLKEESTTSHTVGYFDFIVVGLVGMALMNSSIQGLAISMSKYREDKILKRITTTPLPSWRFIAAEVLSRLVINVLQVSIILAVGIYGFKAHIYGNIALLYVFALIGAILFQLFGFMIAAFARTTQAAEGMATAIAIPMMFLGGVFFPIDTLPKWLYSIVQYVPLAPLLRILRGIGLDATSPFENPINIILVLGWIIVLLFLASYRFRLSEE